MARIRSIKPEFWTSEQVMECSPNARLLFVGLWNFCDDLGRHPLMPRQVRALIFPGDDFTVDDIQRMFDELSENDLIRPYDVDGKRYFQVTGWHHQKIDKPQKPKYPAPLHELSPNARRMVATEYREEGKGEEKKERKEDPASAAEPELGPALSAEDQFWNLAPQFSSGGIPRSRMGALAKSCGGDFVATLRIAQDVLKAKQPSSYLGKIMANQRIEADPAVRRATFDPDLPAFVSAAKAEGMPVEKHPKGWRIGGVIFDPQGEEIGW